MFIFDIFCPGVRYTDKDAVFYGKAADAAFAAVQGHSPAGDEHATRAMVLENARLREQRDAALRHVERLTAALKKIDKTAYYHRLGGIGIAQKIAREALPPQESTR